MCFLFEQNKNSLIQKKGLYDTYLMLFPQLHCYFITFLSQSFFPLKGNTSLKRKQIFGNTHQENLVKTERPSTEGLLASCDGWFYIMFHFSQIGLEMYSCPK